MPDPGTQSAPQWERQSERLVGKLTEFGLDDVDLVGGKNASLGELAGNLEAAGVAVPPGFATTADAYWAHIDGAQIKEAIARELATLGKDPTALATVAARIRQLILDAALPRPLAELIDTSYGALGGGSKDVAVAVRSSATAEDLPDASFAGQHDSYLNVRGADAVRAAVKRCMASLFTDRAISYRERNGFDHLRVALSVGVQRMVDVSGAGSGVMFTLDTETGFDKVVVIQAAWGLGETIVGGAVDPDEFMVFKPLLGKQDTAPVLQRSKGSKLVKAVLSPEAEAPVELAPTTALEQSSLVLSDTEVLQLARYGVAIEEHYGRPMDIEWAKDGPSSQLFVVQARPETVRSRDSGAQEVFRLEARSRVLAQGAAIGNGVATGRARVLERPDQSHLFQDGEILVTALTDPDWGPILRRAAGIVTDRGGRTAHAAIVAREYGIPAVVGCGQATGQLKDGQEVTVSCAEGARGTVFEGTLPFRVEEIDPTTLPTTKTRIMLNLARPSGAFQWHRLPCAGVGLARMEFIINDAIGVHPMALIHPERVSSKEQRARIEELTQGYGEQAEYFVDQLSQGIAMLAASQYPRPIVLRTSDFKSNEYRGLVGGEDFEPLESNPMLGVRGASRYYRDIYRAGFRLECRAIRRVRETVGLDNVIVMIPFCRTIEEAKRVLTLMAEEGLERGKDGLEVYVMAEIPSNILLAEAFAEVFDGFSIGSNDLTQLTLGIDRDSDALQDIFREDDPAVLKLITDLIERAHGAGRPVGLCGQAPSSNPTFARYLVKAGIDSISVDPHSFVQVVEAVSAFEGE